MSPAVVPIKRSCRKGPAQVGNVVPLHTRKETTEDIVTSVRDRTRRMEEQTLAALKGLVASLEQRHRRKAQELVPIGMAMDAPTLADFIEIGQRMLGQKGRRRT